MMRNIWSILYFLCILVLGRLGASQKNNASVPFVINTWPFVEATEKAWQILNVEGGSAVDAVENGCSICEILQCDGSVGFGGSPDENGETTLDAMIMDGTTHDVGAVADLRRVKNAISVARMVMEHTTHTLLVGDQASEFAVQMGFEEESLTTNVSEKIHQDWLNNSCQPNYWQYVVPDPTTSCGPYVPAEVPLRDRKWVVAKEGKNFDIHNHDTIGMIAVDMNGLIAGGTSTNGATHKVPGRVGDSPIPGSGSYVDRHVGGAAATGDGDVMMRFMPALLTVENMRNGFSPQKSAEKSLQQIALFYPEFMGAIVAASITGELGAACYGFGEFHYSVANPQTKIVTVMSVPCIS